MNARATLKAALTAALLAASALANAVPTQTFRLEPTDSSWLAGTGSVVDAFPQPGSGYVNPTLPENGTYDFLTQSLSPILRPGDPYGTVNIGTLVANTRGPASDYTVTEYTASFADGVLTGVNLSVRLEKAGLISFLGSLNVHGDMYTYTENELLFEPGVPAVILSRTASAGSVRILPVAAIPEPGTYALMLGGLALLVGVARRRQTNSI